MAVSNMLTLVSSMSVFPYCCRSTSEMNKCVVIHHILDMHDLLNRIELTNHHLREVPNIYY